MQYNGWHQYFEPIRPRSMRKLTGMILITPVTLYCPVQKRAGRLHVHVFRLWVIQIGTWSLDLHLAGRRGATRTVFYTLCCKRSISPLLLFFVT